MIFILILAIIIELSVGIYFGRLTVVQLTEDNKGAKLFALYLPVAIYTNI